MATSSSSIPLRRALQGLARRSLGARRAPAFRAFVSHNFSTATGAVVEAETSDAPATRFEDPEDFIAQWEKISPFNRSKRIGALSSLDGSDGTASPRVQHAVRVEEKWRRDGIVTSRGSRKSAVASATLREGEGKVLVNGTYVNEYFPRRSWVENVLSPFVVTDTVGQFDVDVRVHGGGQTGQAQATRMAISRCLQFIEPSHREVLKMEGFLRRDARKVERKKPGQAKARKRYQWVKR